MYQFILTWINGCIIGFLLGVIMSFKRGGVYNDFLSEIFAKYTPQYIAATNICKNMHALILAMRDYYLEHEEDIETVTESISKFVNRFFACAKFVQR